MTQRERHAAHDADDLQHSTTWTTAARHTAQTTGAVGHNADESSAIHGADTGGASHTTDGASHSVDNRRRSTTQMMGGNRCILLSILCSTKNAMTLKKKKVCGNRLESTLGRDY
jgi:hypothetical protein